MKKSEIISLIKEKLILERKIKKRALNNKLIMLVIDTFFSVIKENILNGEHIELRGFGTFEAKIREEKKARNPRTNKEVMVKRHAVPVFKAGKEFKYSIKNFYKKI
jgi:nucleoid DNA-binding protein